ncbi:hypothetical protein MEG_00800 [Bartonella tamiae Th307]|uniref:Outer membrane autotransporter barrel domain-containing protein n=2 Tax=Bartonella tamiae TaxID=373638 RepID=J0QXA5_9HYPH|nr:hypothetical protein ME5_01082 [Bartonella tamiae Th239]EJF93942.1 hypothetical protein MEG_00800 [Bartonella tamiae Th307]
MVIIFIQGDGNASSNDLIIQSYYNFEGQKAFIGGAYSYGLFAGDKVGNFFRRLAFKNLKYRNTTRARSSPKPDPNPNLPEPTPKPENPGIDGQPVRHVYTPTVLMYKIYP